MSSASHSAGSSGWLAQKTGAGPTFQWAGKVDAICRSRSNRAKRPRAGCILRHNYTVNINMKFDLICEDLIQSNLKLIHSHIVSNHLSQRPPNKVLQDQTPSVSPAELLLSRETRRTLAQLRTNKSPLLVSYLFSIGDPRHPSPLCPLCLMHDHTSSHLFECKSLPTSLSSLDLWTNPDKVEPFLATWRERLLAAT